LTRFASRRWLRDPRREGTIPLPDGRQLGFAEFGPPGGRPLLWFHGTPGARRQIAPETREQAEEHGVRIVSVERPGVGDSTPHRYRAVRDFAADVASVCDELGIGRFGVAGLSGGGPYALACAHALPDRVVAAIVLGGVAPSVGEDAAAGGATSIAPAAWPLLRLAHAPLGALTFRAIQVLKPLADPAIRLFAWSMPPGDRRLFDDPVTRRMFQEDLILGSRRQMHAVWLDLMLFGRPWGFALSDIRVPVYLRYGDSDTIVPVEHGHHLAGRIPGAKLRVHAGEGHLGGLGAALEIFDVLGAHWPAPHEPVLHGEAGRR